jgi:pyroglutamyl-peptidase
MTSRLLVATVMLGVLSGCAPGPDRSTPGRSRRDSERGGLFHDFLGGKFDSAGHPLGARVFEAERDCAPEVGALEAEGWGASAEADGSGLLCRVQTTVTGGSWTANLRVLTDRTATCQVESDEELLQIVVKDANDVVLGQRALRRGELREALTYQNLIVSFNRWGGGPVVVEAAWTGLGHVRLDYLEIFPAERRLVIEPRSGVLAKNGSFLVEVVNPPEGGTLRVSCDGTDLGAELQQLIDAHEAQSSLGEVAGQLRAPAGKLLSGCALPGRVKVELVSDSWVRETSRVTYLAQDPPCSFAPGTKRVLLTGFEPFPADASSDNSSEQAVLGFDANAVPGVSVMRLVLPVEWDTAATMVARAIDRCRPDVVVSFGQGRSSVEVETTAYNEKDASEIATGTPDNRGVLAETGPIRTGGPEKLSTRLPVAAINAALRVSGVSVDDSDDPGRYICNNVFYSTLHKLESSSIPAGFIHLPRIYKVDAPERAMLQTVVKTAIEETLRASGPSAL